MTNALKHNSVRKTAASVAAVVILGLAAILLKSQFGQSVKANNPRDAGSSSAAAVPAAAGSDPTVELSQSQLASIKVDPVGTYLFPLEKETVGNISFADDLTVQVFPNFQGKIIKALAQMGDSVAKGQALYTIDSPDLIQAESNLIGAAAAYELTRKELERAKELYGDSGSPSIGVSQRELEQATSDEQTAEGALKAARDAVRVFGKTDPEIDQIIASRKIDPVLVVPSPISGQITSFDAPTGLLVQPGNPPAPYTVTDVTVKWMLANVIEGDIPLYQIGEPVDVKVAAYPNRVFQGRVSKIYAVVDPNTHRATIRSEIRDPRNELRTGMLANFLIRVQKPVESMALPVDGVVREADGAMTAWVTADRHRFIQRTVKTGLRVDGHIQILEGLNRGELAVSEGAIFLSNMLEAPPSD